jgi:hypothetical protein
MYRLRALVSKRDWNELEEWSKTRKSPIGWEVRFSLSFPLSVSPANPFCQPAILHTHPLSRQPQARLDLHPQSSALSPTRRINHDV